jgi:uncharacterized protein YecE (DUF72 family)
LIARWAAATERRFLFALKLWRRITHEKRLTDCSGELREFLAITAGLGGKHGPLLVQLPPSLRRDLDRLEAFLEDLERARGKAKWKAAFEFRNADWICSEVNALLDRRGAALCLADYRRCPVARPNQADFVYIRRHGPSGDYRGCYSESALAADAQAIRAWLGEGREVYVYFNNDIGGHAVDNARRLAELVGV